MLTRIINVRSWSKFNKCLTISTLLQLAAVASILHCVTGRNHSDLETQPHPPMRNSASKMTVWHSFGQHSAKETFLKLKDTTSPSGTGRSFLATLCLLTFKVIKYACLCSLLFFLFILICPFLPLLIPVVIFSLLFLISLIPLFGANPPSPVLPSIPTTTTTEEPPFTAIPARKT